MRVDVDRSQGVVAGECAAHGSTGVDDLVARGLRTAVDVERSRWGRSRRSRRRHCCRFGSRSPCPGGTREVAQVAAAAE
jgi:hypothetical protein